jgi:hypothetical protein
MTKTKTTVLMLIIVIFGAYGIPTGVSLIHKIEGYMEISNEINRLDDNNNKLDTKSKKLASQISELSKDVNLTSKTDVCSKIGNNPNIKITSIIGYDYVSDDNVAQVGNVQKIEDVETLPDDTNMIEITLEVSDVDSAIKYIDTLNLSCKSLIYVVPNNTILLRILFPEVNSNE